MILHGGLVIFSFSFFLYLQIAQLRAFQNMDDSMTEIIAFYLQLHDLVTLVYAGAEWDSFMEARSNSVACMSNGVA